MKDFMKMLNDNPALFIAVVMLALLIVGSILQKMRTLLVIGILVCLMYVVIFGGHFMQKPKWDDVKKTSIETIDKKTQPMRENAKKAMIKQIGE